MTDAVGTVTYTDDALNRVTATTDRRGNTQFFTYDATKQIVQVKDRNGNATQYVYDGNGNIVKTIDALGTESVFGYNKNNQLVSTDLHRVDTLNGVDSHEITLYEYGGRNLVAREVNARGDSTIYIYDGNGNMVSKTDADGYVTQYSYTALDLVKKINYNGAKEASYQYNKVGELVQMLIDHAGATLFPQCDILRSIGRVSFLLYAFLLAQGCKHTHSMERYLLGLGIFALISEIPYDLAFGISINFLDQTNIFYTLFLSAACVYIYIFQRMTGG